MKFNKLKIKEIIVLVLCLLTSPWLNAFTYQGRLHNQGDPAQGAHEMYFTLYDAVVKGNVVSNTIKLYDVEVMNGYFTVDLDFGTSAYVFNGQSRWLNIEVKPADSKIEPEILSPRQKISPVPYAAHAGVAERLAPLTFISNYIIRMEVDNETKGYFHYFDQIGQTVDVITYQDGEDRILRKRPGRSYSPNVELKCFARPDLYLVSWFESIKQSVVERKTVTFSILNQDGYIVDRWELANCWPRMIRYDYEPRFDTVVMTFSLVSENMSHLSVPSIQKPVRWLPGPQPLIKKPFRLDFESDESLSFNSFTHIGTEVEVIEYLNGDDLVLRKRPGRISTLDPIFVRPVQYNQFLREWHQGVLDGRVARYSPSLSLNNSAGEPVIQGALMHCWPSTIQSKFDAASKEMNEYITLACEEFDLN